MTTLTNNIQFPFLPDTKKSSPSFNSSFNSLPRKDLSLSAPTSNTTINVDDNANMGVGIDDFSIYSSIFVAEDIKNLAAHMQACEPCNKVKHQIATYIEVLQSFISPRVVTSASLLSLVALSFYAWAK